MCSACRARAPAAISPAAFTSSSTMSPTPSPSAMSRRRATTRQHYNSCSSAIRARTRPTTPRSFTITADDGEALNNSGSASASLTVVTVDDAPVNTVPADSAVPTAFSNTNTAISGISVADVDRGRAPSPPSSRSRTAPSPLRWRAAHHQRRRQRQRDADAVGHRHQRHAGQQRHLPQHRWLHGTRPHRRDQRPGQHRNRRPAERHRRRSHRRRAAGLVHRQHQ